MLVSPSFFGQVWGGVINRDMTTVLVSMGIYSQELHDKTQVLVTSAPPQGGGVTNIVVWVGLGSAFGNLSMESILICGVPRELNIICYTMSKLKTRGAAASQ